MSIKPHCFPEVLERSSHFRVLANGVPVEALHHHVADHAQFECDGAVEIVLELSREVPAVVIRPLRGKISAEIRGTRVAFTLPGPRNVQVEIAGLPLLYIYALPPLPEPPGGREVVRFAAGKVHDAGVITLTSGQVCWIEPGAVVRGSIQAAGAHDVVIGGYGILDAARGSDGRVIRRRAILLDGCRDARVEGILLRSPCGWMITIGGCEGVAVDGIRQLGREGGTDGVDVVGSRNIAVTNCCLHNGDDNIAVKALHRSRMRECAAEGARWDVDVEHVRVSHCIFYNCAGGSAMEIGYETTTDLIQDVVFEDIDVLGVHDHGSVFGIHNGDRALVKDVRWENIRVEHHYDKLVDFRTLFSRWNVDDRRGQVRDVVLKQIRVMQSVCNAGYTVSVISGFDADHTVSGVRFEDFQIDNRCVTNADDLDLVTRNAHNIRFS
jgi:hypothetical protein